MCVVYLRIDEHQALRVNPEESLKSVHDPEQAQPQVPHLAEYSFM